MSSPRLERWYTCPDCGQSIRVAADSITIAGQRHWLPEVGQLGEHLVQHAKAYADDTISRPDAAITAAIAYMRAEYLRRPWPVEDHAQREAAPSRPASERQSGQ